MPMYELLCIALLQLHLVGEKTNHHPCAGPCSHARVKPELSPFIPDMGQVIYFVSVWQAIRRPTYES